MQYITVEELISYKILPFNLYTSGDKILFAAGEVLTPGKFLQLRHIDVIYRKPEEKEYVPPEIEPEPIPVTPAVPVQVADEVVPTVEIPATPAPVEEEVVAEPDVVPVEPESPFLTDETVVATPPKPIIDMVVDKPAYNVSQNEKMFVAAPEYETDVVAQEEIETCADGAAPDADGCCAGEELVDMGDGTLMCCSADECFPPML